MKRSNISYVDGILLFVAFLWGINPTIMKVGLRHIPPMPYNAVRMVFAVATAWVIVILSKSNTKIEKKDYKKLFFVSVFGFFIYQLCFTVGVNMTTSGNVLLILSTLPISVALINKFLGIEEIPSKMWGGIILSIIGVLLIIVGSGKELSLSSGHVKGGIVLFVAQISYGYFTVFSKDLSKKYSNSLVMAYIVTISGVLFMGTSIKSVAQIHWGSIPMEAWMSNLYSAIFSISIGNFLWVFAVQKIGSTKTSLYTNLPPIFGIITGYVFLSEPFYFVQFIGAAVIFMGLYFTRKAKGTTDISSAEAIKER